MQYTKIIISSLILVGTIYFLSYPLSLGETTLPALGSFVNPATGFWKNAEPSNTKDFTINSDVLKAEVNAYYDERHVPHIYAENIDDLLFAQGYIIAKERLWQMDISTRAVEGTTAEVVGERGIDNDKSVRNQAFAKSAEIAIEAWKKNKEGYRNVESFSAGVNYYIDNLAPSDYPLEFKLLGYAPQKWSPYRTALFIKAMCRTLNSRYTDIAATNALNTFGKEVFDELYPDYNKKQSPIIQEMKWPEANKQADLSFESKLLKPYDEIYQSEDRVTEDFHIGSNNWAVNGQKTASGNAILSNDPHLKLSLPSIWLEMHLVCPEFNVYGVALPGMSGIVIGFNEHIAWGNTNVGHDVLDLYKIAWVDDKKEQYLLDGKKLEVELVVEKIKVKGSAEVLDTVRYTTWGPVKKEKDGREELAMKWLSHNAPFTEEVDVYLNINRAKNYTEFRNAIKGFYAPAQNFVFSDKTGDIALHVTGQLPIKADQQGRFIQDGSLSTSDWQGYIPFDNLPQELNPSRNYVSSANQHSTNRDYPYYYNGGFEDYRGRYINRQLEGMNNIEKEDMMNLQLDAYSLKAEEALPIMLAMLDSSSLDDRQKNVHDLLKNWNYRYDVEEEAAIYFNLWWQGFQRITFDEIIAEREHQDFLFPEPFRLVELMQEEPENLWFDIKGTSRIEQMYDIVNAAFAEMNLEEITPSGWSAHRATAINHLANIPAFNHKKMTSPGSPDTPNAISKYNGPSWRMIVELDDPIKAYGIFPGGQSGNPGSPYYDNFTDDWAAGEYYELNYTRNATEINSTQQITFKK